MPKKSHKRKKEDNDDDDTEHKSERKSKRSKHRRSSPPADEPPSETAEASGQEISLSVDDTNALRAKLGLAPLETGNSTQPEQRTESGEKLVTVDGNTFVHKPADSLTSKKKEEKLKEKLDTHKERRRIVEKLSTVKTLTADDDDDSAAKWVEKSRQLAKERELAAQREKILEDLDKDFGVGEVIEKELLNKTEKYTSKHLAGIAIEHSKSSFIEGRDTILVLKDKDVLDETAEDVLINPTLVDEVKWRENAELRKKKPGYNPYEDGEFDELGRPKEKNLLSKYDEELEGKKAETFRIEHGGKVNLEREREMAAIKKKLYAASETLEAVVQVKLATEYYDVEEMQKFKKRKVVKKRVRKRGTEEELQLVAEEKKDDYGSRTRGKGRAKAEYEGEEKAPSSETRPATIDALKMEEDEMVPEEDLSGAGIEDEPDLAEAELEKALEKARLLKQQTAREMRGGKVSAAERVKQGMRTAGGETFEREGDEGETSTMVLDSVSEYCRGLGDIPTYGMAGNREDVDEEQMMMDFESAHAVKEEPAESSDEEEEGGSKKREKMAKEVESNSPQHGILDDELDVTVGVGAALQLAAQKGYLERGGDRGGSGQRLTHIQAKNYSILDKQFQDIDDKYAKKLDRMGMGGGPIQEFREKKDFTPDFKLEYADARGKLLTTKDAFRELSWKFHGKKPGKKSIEKRTQRERQQELLRQMASTDTPLGTLTKQMEKQRSLQAPYIVLSGSGVKDQVSTSIKKD